LQQVFFRKFILVKQISMKFRTAVVSFLFFQLFFLAKNGQAYTDTVTTMIRQPYLQQGDTSSVILRWRTAKACTSKVKYGFSAGSLTTTLLDTTLTREHIVLVSGLLPDTRYYYSVGSTLQTFLGDTTTYFVTAPGQGSTRPVYVWATGDCGFAGTIQTNVRDKYLNYMGGRHTDLWLLLGDNAYTNGLDAEYQGNFFNIYKSKLLRQTTVWPAPGNHEYANNASLQVSHAISYYDIFSLPANAEMGGVPSGTESWYSFNYGNIHFVSLDSYGIDTVYRMSDTLGPQATWLKNDLAANTQMWTIVYWHHPPYTMGSHNSDTETELVDIRQKLIPLLDRYNVDLVLGGHSHTYERSRLMRGNYGMENSYDPLLHAVSNSSGRYDGTTNSCPYIKNASGGYRGTVYTVAGTSSRLAGSQLSYPHAAMYCSNDSVGGSVALTIQGNRLDLKMIGANGVIYDKFTMFRNVNTVLDTQIVAGQSITLQSSWQGDHTWSDTALSGQSVTITPDSSVTISVTDSSGCLQDVFTVDVCYPVQVAGGPSDTVICENTSLLFPVSISGTGIITYQWESSADGISWLPLSAGPVFSGVQSDTLSADSLSIVQDGLWLRVIVNNDCGSDSAAPFRLTVLPFNSPQVTVSASADSVCAGSLLNLDAVSSGSGLFPSYQWYRNGAPAGIDSTGFGSSAFAEGDSIFCVVTSSAICNNYPVDTSNVIYAHVLPVLNPAVIISPAGSVSVLPGDTLAFTAFATAGGTDPQYQWYVNGSPAGSDTAVFSSSYWSDGDLVYCVLTSNAFCTDTAMAGSDTAVISLMVTTSAPGSSQPVKWKLYPNGAFSQTQLFYQLNDNAGMKVELLDMKGRTLRTIIPAGAGSSGTITIPLQDLAGGIYLVRLITARYSGVLKLAVLER
jgi:hypothetical protein